MSFSAYPKYKDSGVAWLGEVPSHWDVVPLWTLFRRTKRTGFPDEELLSVYRDYGVLVTSSRDDNFNKASEDLGAYQFVNQGDLVINKMKAWQGSVGISGFRGIVSPAYFVFEPLHSMSSRYLHFLFRSEVYFSVYMAMSKGIRINQWDLDPQSHSRLSVLLPPRAEQGAIAAFLDHEIAKIDALIAEQEKLIELLKEKRQAVISQAVTKGLDPTVPMKDSGVEWLGQVPEHWNVTRVKFVCSKIVDCLHSTPEYDDDGKYYVVRTADVDRGILLTCDMRKVTIHTYIERISRLEPLYGDIVYSREGERFGMAALIPENMKVCLGQRMMMLRVSKEVESTYLMWFLNSLCVYNQVRCMVGGATSPHVNIADVVNFYIVNPPIEEQQGITGKISLEAKRIDTLLAESQKAITLLKERRSALISAAVTGKIDVRGYAPQQEAV